MSTFSSSVCYAALYVFSNKNLLEAYARMVAALVQKQRFEVCDISLICDSFNSFYGFSVPYHPMQTIINECIKLDFFTYNTSTHKCLPNYAVIDEEDFMNILEQKNCEYQRVLNQFSDFLINNHSIHSSPEDLNEKILAFIERYGLKTKYDRNILKKVRNDYLFAEFLVHCEESGNNDILNFLDEYTIGLALSEIIIFNEKPEKKSNHANVYLDAGIIFKLLGIDSTNRSNCYVEFVKSMQHLGMRIFVYEHTVTEIIGIIENSKHWIGNPDFDATLCSEATYYFVSNGWSVERVNELSCNIRSKLKDEFNINIDKINYPKAEDIKTPFEADIKDQIIRCYQESDPEFDSSEKDFTIDQDAKSIFLTQHKNGNTVSYHIDDVNNIFITTNRNLAKVGYNISYNMASSKDFFIPVVMNDIKWGTLVWFNTPSRLSSINRPRLVSAAYAAFRPTNEVVSKLNQKLKELEESGDITPEQCYLLKVSPIAQQLLAKKTINEPDRFVDSTPYEILQELERKAFNKGVESKQKEIHVVNRDKQHAEFCLKIERQRNIIFQKSSECMMTQNSIENIKSELNVVTERLEEYEQIGNEVTSKVDSNIRTVKIILSIAAILGMVLGIYIICEFSWLWSIIPFIGTIYLFIFEIWDHKMSLKKIVSFFQKRALKKYSTKLHYSDVKVQDLKKKKIELEEKLKAEGEKLEIQNTELKKEKMKLDDYSADISLFEE